MILEEVVGAISFFFHFSQQLIVFIHIYLILGLLLLLFARLYNVTICFS
jgi:hypothetical protein